MPRRYIQCMAGMSGLFVKLAIDKNIQNGSFSFVLVVFELHCRMATYSIRIPFL